MDFAPLPLFILYFPAETDTFGVFERGTIAETRSMCDRIRHPNFQSSTGYSLLHAACQNPLGEDTVRELLLRGADPNITDFFGLRPVHVAASRGHHGCLRVLL